MPHTDIISSLVPPADIFVGGEWKRGRGALYASVYPADGSVNAEITTADADDAREAVEAADAAWRKPNWSGLKPHQRALILYRIADLIMAKHEALAQLQRRDNGKPINETRVLVASAANTFRYFAACLETLDEDVTPSRGDYLTMSVHEPIGVIAAITPWNSPIASDAQKLAPALAAGNAVVLKPAEVTPLASLALARICEEAGVPKGVLSVLPGKGSVIGDVLVRHPLVKKVSFTGGTEVGRGIARIAADKLMPVSLELGGKSPTMVFDDADLDHAVNGVLYGIFSSSGEACIAGSRLFVQRSIYPEFMKRLAEWQSLCDRKFYSLTLSGVAEWMLKYAKKDSAIRAIEATNEVLCRLSGSFAERLLFLRQDNNEPTPGALILTTMHSSKGLEWDHVWIARSEETIVPDAKSTEPEERRLFYVAMTRARESLMISGTSKNFESRFVVEAQLQQIAAAA